MGDFVYGYFDAKWAYNVKVRKLQRRFPAEWPLYWCAYMAILGEAWAHRTRDVDFEDALPPALSVDVQQALAALQGVGLLDKDGRIPADSWDEWFGPVQARIDIARQAGIASGLARRKPPNGGNGGSTTVQPESNDRSTKVEPREGGIGEKGNGMKNSNKGFVHIRDLLPPPPGYDEAKKQ